MRGYADKERKVRMNKIYFVLAIDKDDLETIKESMSLSHDHELFTDEDVIHQFIDSRDINEIGDIHDHLEFVEMVNRVTDELNEKEIPK